MKIVSLFNKGFVLTTVGILFFNSCANGNFAVHMKEEKNLTEVKAAIEKLKSKEEEIKTSKKANSEKIQTIKLENGGKPKGNAERSILKLQIAEQNFEKELSDLTIKMLELKIEKSELDEIEEAKKIEKSIKKEEEKLTKLKEKEAKLKPKE